MFTSLDKIDLVSTDQRTGERMLVQTDHRSPEELDDDKPLSVLFASARIRNASSIDREVHGPGDRAVYCACRHTPPAWLIEVVETLTMIARVPRDVPG